MTYQISSQEEPYLINLIGPNSIDNNILFFKTINTLLAETKKWKMNDIRTLNQMIADGFKGFLREVFVVRANKHPLFMKYYGDKVNRETPSLDEIHMFSRKLKSGEWKQQDMLEYVKTNFTGSNLKTVKAEEFLTTNQERKELAIDRKFGIIQTHKRYWKV
jgi:hypothetical protein